MKNRKGSEWATKTLSPKDRRFVKKMLAHYLRGLYEAGFVAGERE